MKLRALRYTLLLSGLFGISFLLRASLPSVATGTWVAAGNMSAARSGACTMALNDGRLLISGGADANGPTATADLFSTTGSWSAAASMNSPRSHQSCAVLQDGRVLVAGGTTSGGGITNSAEVYDPSADSWAQAGLMNDARSGATASVLQDGRVLIAGGQNSGGASNTLEIFDPNSGNFSNAGTMSSPRQDHAAAVLSDGRVLIVGGSSDGTNALNTTDIYDPQVGSVSPGPAMSTPRAKATATTLLDGSVVVIGGSNGTADLASAEFFDLAANNFNAAGSLATANSKHSAFLLPNNNEVLVVGGQSAGNDLASAELYIPWQKAFQATGPMATPRSDASGAALTKADGRAFIAGGSSASAELYGFATVKTDAADYPPGTTVNITGSGWQPGETVTLTLVESPLLDTHGPYTATADAFGNISNSSFVTDTHDENIRFYLTAAASQSQTQNTFTDSKPNTVTVGTQSPNPIAPGSSTSYTVTVNFNGNGSSCTSPLSITTSLPTGATASFSPSSLTSTGGDAISTLTISTTNSTPPGSTTFTVLAANGGGTCQAGTATNTGTLVVVENTATTLASSVNPSTFGQSTTLTATVAKLTGATTPTGGTVTFLDGAATLGTATLNNGTATLPVSSLTAGSHSLTASYGGVTNTFGSSTSSAVTQTVNKSNTTTTLASSANPSVFGQSVTFTATVAAVLPGAGNPPAGETVTFKDGANTIGTANTNASGVATLTISSLSISGSPHSITASYPGNANFNLSTSSALLQTVNPATTTTSVGSSTNPSVFGQSVTFTATVSATAPGTGTPSGTVQFAIDGTNFGSPVTISGGSATSGATSSLSVGNHTITAAFTDTDNNYNNSTSGNFAQTVNQASTTTAVSSSLNPSVFGQSVTFTATVSVTAPGSGTPAGTVNFQVGGTTITGCGTAALNGSAQATCATTSLAVGNDTITAIYSGNANFNTSTSPNYIQTVETVPVITSVNNATFGEGTPGTFTVTATGFPTPTLGESGALPSGVTFNTATDVLSGTPDTGTAGTYNVTFSATNVAGTASQSFTLTVLPPPTAPSQPLLLPSTLGNPEDNVTASQTPAFHGTTTGSIVTVTIYSDGVQVGSGSPANYSNNTVGVSASTLSLGTHVITAKATDAAGAVSAASAPLTIQVINTITKTDIGVLASGNGQNNATVTSLTESASVPKGDTIFVTLVMDPYSTGATVSA